MVQSFVWKIKARVILICSTIYISWPRDPYIGTQVITCIIDVTFSFQKLRCVLLYTQFWWELFPCTSNSVEKLATSGNCILISIVRSGFLFYWFPFKSRQGEIEKGVKKCAFRRNDKFKTGQVLSIGGTPEILRSNLKDRDERPTIPPLGHGDPSPVSILL